MKLLASVLALAVASPAMAGPWVDSFGRSTEMQFPGSTPVTYRADSHTLADGVGLFDRICLKTGFDRAAVEKVVGESGWGFTYLAEMMPFKQPVDIGGWNTTDATVRVADVIFFNKKPQCSFAFQPQQAADMATIQDTVSKVVGKAPDNAAKQFDKSGKPRKYYTPEWSVVGADGANLKIFALPLPYNSGAIRLAALKN